MRRTAASKVRVGWLVTRSAGRATLARIFASPAYRWRFNRREPERLLLAPQDLRAADPTRAAEITAGRFTFAGKTVDLGSHSPFVIIAPSAAWREALFGFTWLRHLRADAGTGGRATARRLVGEFVRSPVAYSPEALEPTTTARRLLALLTQAPLALDGADRGFYRAFIRSVNWQMHYLARAGGVARDGVPRLLCAVAATQASLCLSDKGSIRRRATRLLGHELQRQVLIDGGHLSRNPQAIIELLLDLLPLRQSFAARNILPPQELLGAIDRMMPMLRFFRHVDGAFATFNGMGYTQAHLVATLLTYDDARGKPVQNAPHSGYQRVERAGSAMIVDSGKPPPVGVAQEAHAGTLSFEFSADAARILVNCGAPAGGRAAWRHAARITAAHNTLTLGDRSSAEFGPAGSAERLIARPLVAGPREVSVERRDEAGGVSLVLRHDGYRRAFGALHERCLAIDASGVLTGTDRLVTPGGGAWAGRTEAVLRFHLHPAVTASDDGGTILLLLPNGRRWRFAAEGAVPTLQESVHFANPEGPRRTMQVVLAFPAEAPAGPLGWSLAPAA